MERYSEYKDSGVQWLGEIPSHWETPRLNQIGKYINGYAFKPKDWTDSGLPIIRIQDLTGSNDNPNYFSGSIDTKYLIHDNDILVSWAATLDAYVWKRGDAWLNQHIFKAIPHSTINSHFYLWLLKVAMENLNNDNKHGIMMQHLTAVVFNHFRVPLPPISEQQAIADYLDTATARIDEAIAQQQKMIDLLNERKQIIINNAVTKGLNPDAPMKDSGVDWIGEIPGKWNAVRIKYLLNEKKERSATGSEEPLSMSQKYGLIPTKEMDIVPNMASSFVGAKVVSKGNLVFNKLKAHLGVFATSEYDGLVSPDYAVYEGTGLADLKYLEYIFKTPKCIAEFVKLITGVGAGLSRLYTGDLYSIYVPLPSIEEQTTIVEYVDSSTLNIKTAIAHAERQISLLQERKQIIINDVVTGKVKVC